MKISLNWIRGFVDIPAKYSPRELADLLTVRTCEVEGYEDEARNFSNMVVGYVTAIRPHPNANKLKLADTDIGGKIVQIVCGGKNLEAGMTVPVALPGTIVNWHGAGETVKLKETKIRGEVSFGMICAGEEIGLPPAPPEGITDLEHLLLERKLPPAKPGTPLAKALGLDDVIIEIDNKSITHRPDLWGHYGLAREFAGVLRKKLKHYMTRLNTPKKGETVKVEIGKGKGDIPYIAERFIATIITGVTVAPSPEWMQKRLRAIGLRPVNNIVDITNYVMYELGYPLHAFDRRTVGNDRLAARFAHEGEVIETLDHKKRALHPEDALVTNGERALGIAGIMGGLNSEITPQTTEIILEAACWNPVMIRKTSQRHNLRSDAAQRFEKSLDPEINGIAFHRACELILEICPGSRFAGPITDVYPAKQKVRKLSTLLLDPARVSKKIGVPIGAAEVAKHLKALEFGVAKAAKGKLKITIPTFRATKDINIEDDLVEEVVRMHGYEKIPALLPALPIRLPRQNRERMLKHECRDVLSLALGFSELNHYSFYGKPEIRSALLPENLHFEVANPLTTDQTHMRISLLPNMLKSVALNLYQREEFRLYEIGRTYLQGGAYFPTEEKFICGMVVNKGRKEIFYDALRALQMFFLELHVSGAKFGEAKSVPPYAHPTKCAAVTIGGEEVAAIFEIHPQVLKNFSIEAPVAAFELNFSRFARLYRDSTSYAPLPRFPGIEIDVSVLVPKHTNVRAIQKLIERVGQALVAGVSLRDIFEDKSLGADKKSFTFRVLLQSPDRTLTDDEMRQVQEKVWGALRESGFEVR